MTDASTMESLAAEAKVSDTQVSSAVADCAKPIPDVPRPAAHETTSRQPAGEGRSPELRRVRAAVKAQLATIQQQRRDLSQSLGKIHAGLAKHRTEIRSQIRQQSAAACKSRVTRAAAPDYRGASAALLEQTLKPQSNTSTDAAKP